MKCMNLDGQDPKELIFWTITNDTLLLCIYGDNDLIGQYKLFEVRDHARDNVWDGGLCDIADGDLNGDGMNDLIITVNTCFDLRPRGIFVYDLQNMHELWHFWIGGSPRDLNIADINNDGHKEIIISTIAVGNGNSVNGFDDSNSFIIALSSNGKKLWARRIGGVFTNLIIRVCDIDNDGNIEIIAAETEGTANSTEPNKIYIVDAQDGRTKKYIAGGEKYMGMIVKDINRDEKMEIVTGNTDGIIRIYNSQLDLILQKNTGLRVQLINIDDYNGDGSSELIARSGEDAIVLYDEYLNEIAAYRLKDGERIECFSVLCGKSKKLMVYGTEKTPHTYALLAVGNPIFYDRILKSQSPVLIILVIVLFLIIGILFVRQAMTVRKYSRQKLQSDRILEWSDIAQRLAHDIKNPLSTINLTLQRIQGISRQEFGKRSAVLDEYINSVLEEVARLRDSTDKFMRILSLEKPSMQANDINDIINDALAKFKNTISPGIDIKKSFAPDIPLVSCDRNQISIVFSNIISNAMAAMAKKGILNIRTSLSDRVVNKILTRFVEIKIEDTGRGIKKEDLQNLFKPFHTTKRTGTGLGLIITKHIIDQHGGDIWIESKPDIGTIVTIKLPLTKARPGSDRS